MFYRFSTSRTTPAHTEKGCADTMLQKDDATRARGKEAVERLR